MVKDGVVLKTFIIWSMLLYTFPDKASIIHGNVNNGKNPLTCYFSAFLITFEAVAVVSM